MKSFTTAALLAAATLAAPAFAHAQESTALTGMYGNLGYAHAKGNGVSLGAIQGRLGYRADNYMGAEGELGVGIDGDRVGVAPGVNARVKLRHQEAIYGVGFVPVSPQFDVLARVGYGATTVRASAAGLHDTDTNNSINYGVGAQYHFDGANGVRADFTRHDYLGGGTGHANVWSVAYSRRF
jgi:hypothetical protein